ncbi:hypothetical protein BaRGS_00037406 [Batillaria attramentaria]|uniref:Uncharacterized protein n=1 Tax=Batillaria attramentaria TaxID=370345 RepID=A0ABD0J981_9CAEN
MSLDLDAKTHSLNYVGEAEGCYGAPTARCRRQTLEQDGKKAVVFTTVEGAANAPPLPLSGHDSVSAASLVSHTTTQLLCLAGRRSYKMGTGGVRTLLPKSPLIHDRGDG